MKKIFVIIILILGAAGLTFAQTDSAGVISPRESKKVDSFERSRPVGESRLWTFISRDTVLGQLTSVVRETTAIDGRNGYVLEEKLNLKMERNETRIALDIEGEHYLANEGFYLGDKLKLKINDLVEKFEFKLKKGQLEGFFTRSGEKIKKNVPFERNYFAWETYFVDQLELFLAFRDFKVGDTLVDTIYAQQSMYKTPLVGTVDGFIFKEIYKNKFDSVFVIHLTAPQEYYLYVTADRRLIRTDFPQHRIRAYLDRVNRSNTAQLRKPAYTMTTFLASLPAYILYALIAVLALLFLERHGFKWARAYIALLAGIILYLVMLVTQFPLQKAAISQVVIPALSSGGSLYSWGILPSLIVGFIQEGLKLLIIFLLCYYGNVKEAKYIIVGVFSGAGFGLMEACYLAEPSGILGTFSYSLLENGFLIIFHIVSGLLLGYALKKNWPKITLIAVGLIIANSFLRYLPIFVQQKVFTVGVMYFVFAFLILLILGLTVTLINRETTTER
ncbi:MAG: hypothetical protein ACOYVF_04125 [Candidatus Zixiibacteriota bacterium]